MAGERRDTSRKSSDTALELAELLSHSARRLRRGSTAQLAPLGLTAAQARVLRMVASAGRPLRMADIAPVSKWSPGRSPPWWTASRGRG